MSSKENDHYNEAKQDALYEYACTKRYTSEMDNRQWDCLVALIEDGTINTLEELQKYTG